MYPFSHFEFFLNLARRITVYGGVPPSSGDEKKDFSETRFLLDGKVVGTYSGTEQAATQYAVRYWGSNDLPPAPDDSDNHQLTVEVLRGEVLIDYFEISGVQPSSSSVAIPSPTDGAGNQSNSTTVSNGPIIGGVIGGVAVGGLLVFLVLFLRLRRRNAEKQKLRDHSAYGMSNYTQFTLCPPYLLEQVPKVLLEELRTSRPSREHLNQRITQVEILTTCTLLPFLVCTTTKIL